MLVVVMFMYIVYNQWISMDNRISDEFGFGAISMPMDIFMGGLE